MRIDGEIRDVPTAWKTMEVPFRDGTRFCMTIPWGDVASAYLLDRHPQHRGLHGRSRKQMARMRRFRFLLPLLGFGPIQKLAQRRIEKTVKGPSDEVRREARSRRCGAA